MSNDDDELRQEELQVLQSIYPDYIIEANTKLVRLEIPVELDGPHRVVLSPDSSKASSSSSSSSTTTTIPQIEVSNLPSIFVDIHLSDGYPSSSAPVIPFVYSTSSWLPEELELTQLLRKAWHGEGVLCTIVELVRSGEFLGALGLVENARIRLSYPGPILVSAHYLLDYDAKVACKQFSQSSFPCSICLTSIRGARCIQLPCSHVFCRSCLQEFWSFCIAEGSVERVGCPESSCVKESQLALEEEVKRVVTEKEVLRWKWLRTKKEIEKDPSITHCPIPACQEPVKKPPTDPNASSGWERFRSCSYCGFNFCSFCKHTWHGALTECPKSATHAVIMEYMDLPEGSPQRATLERRYGRQTIVKLVKDYEEEESTKQWLQSSTTSCPRCKVSIEKSMGCNHMHCVKCDAHFCYKCGEGLDQFNPYKHFSTPGLSQCYGKLFDGVAALEEDGWQRVEWLEEI